MKTIRLISYLSVLFISSPVFAASVNEVRIEVDPAELTTATATPIKYEFKKATVTVNRQRPQAAELKIRGQNCLKSTRRCFGIKVEQKVTFEGEDGLEAKSLNLISLWQDQGYISSKIGFEFFKAAGLFDLKSEYAEVFINGASNGLYLVTEKPTDAIERIQSDAFIARRGAGKRFEVAEKSPKSSKHTDEQFLAAYQTLLTEINPLRGQRLKDRISESLNLESYMNWLIANSLLENGDYTDEVYFYADARENQIRFNVFPWDLDDLFKNPHSGAPNRKYAKEIETGLLYSFENSVDVKIGTDSLLLEDLKQVASPFLNKLVSDSLVDQVIEKVRESITPYLNRSSVLRESIKDNGRAKTKSGILTMLETRSRQIKERRDELSKRALR